MNYDDAREFSDGIDLGLIIEGDVVYDDNKDEYVLLDDEGVAFSTQKLFESLKGKKIRFTCVSFEAIQVLEGLVNGS